MANNVKLKKHVFKTYIVSVLDRKNIKIIKVKKKSVNFHLLGTKPSSQMNLIVKNLKSNLLSGNYQEP